MKRISMVFAVVVVATALASTTFAFGPGGGGWGRGHHGQEACFDQRGDMAAMNQLNLTAEQIEKIKVLRETHVKDIKPIRDKMFSKRGELRLLWLQTSPDQHKIMAMQKEIRSLRDQLEDKQTSQRLAVFNVLTPEQQTKAQAYGAGRGNYGGGRFAGGPGGPGSGPKFGPGAHPCGN